MKRHIILALTALFVLAGLCLGQTGAAKTSLDDALVAKEKEVWEAFKRKDANALKSLISDDAYEVDDEGTIQTKADQIASLADLTITDYTMEDIKVIKINPTTAIVRYKVTVKGTYKGMEFEPHPSMASAVWANRGGRWQNVLYQETRIKQ